jgi:hypothetical protein
MAIGVSEIMYQIFLISLSAAILVLLMHVNLSGWLLLSEKRLFSDFLAILALTLTGASLYWFFLNAEYAFRRKIKILDFLLLPSSIVPFLFLIFQYVPLVWSLIDPNFKIDYINRQYLDETIAIISASFILLMAGIVLGRKKFLARSNRRISKDLFPSRSADDFLNLFKKPMYFNGLIAIAALSASFQVGLRLDFLFQGGRGFVLNNLLLQSLIPLAGILSTILTIFSGFCYAKTNKYWFLLVPFLDTLPRLANLSRGFFIPILLFFVAASLMGKKFPAWLYFAAPLISIFSSALALISRGISTGGTSGFFLGASTSNQSFVDSFKLFFEVNAYHGILSQAVASRDPLIHPIDGLISWLSTVSPLPSFLGLNTQVPSVAQLLGITSVGLPMPMIGDVYFRMGWGGLILLFLLGWWMGRLEANIILHPKIYGTAYWPHVLLWLALLQGLILSFHSATRASSRVVIYALFFIWVINLLPLNPGKIKQS